MELGLGFDDDDFDSTSNTTKKPELKSYNAKHLSPLWFKDLDSNDAEQNYKYMGDHYYHGRHYDKAIHCYTMAADLISANNKTMRRDVQESLARCYVRDGRQTEALEMGHILLDTAITSEQKLQSLSLLSNLQESACDWLGMEASTKQLLEMHPYNGRLWLSLARCIQHRQTEGKGCWYRVLSCLTRARLLFKSTRRSVGSFVGEKHNQIIQQIDEEIGQMNPDEQVLKRVTQAMGEDIYNADQQDDKADKELTQDTVDFDLKWFSWTKDLQNP